MSEPRVIYRRTERRPEHAGRPPVRGSLNTRRLRNGSPLMTGQAHSRRASLVRRVVLLGLAVAAAVLVIVAALQPAEAQTPTPTPTPIPLPTPIPSGVGIDPDPSHYIYVPIVAGGQE
jgi:hypothetical protein